MDFEKNLKELEDIVEKMSEGKLNLTDSLKSFKKGMGLVSECQKSLNQAEQKVEELIKINSDGTLETKPFNSNEPQE